MNSVKLSPEAEFAIERLEQNGFEAFAVGGCVRDSLLDRTPSDWDLTTNATPDEVLQCFSDFRTVETGLKHGTVTVLIDRKPLEITTYRQDGEYLDNRHPSEVTFSRRIEDDLSRRDFTVNAMAYNKKRGLCDLFGGENDLQNGVIRCVGDPEKRFHEDGLRILRAVRFASVLGFAIESETAKAVKNCRDLLDNIAKERIRVEWDKLLMGKNAVEILRNYPEIVSKIFPEAEKCFGFAQNSKFHCYDVWEHTLVALSHANDDLIVRLALFFHDLGKPDVYTEDENGGHFKGHARISLILAQKAMERLKYDNSTMSHVLKLVEMHDIKLPDEKKLVKRLMLKLSDEDIERLREVQRCDRLAHHPNYREFPPAWFRLPEIVAEIKSENACLSLKTLAVNGDDLLALGIPKGKEIGRVLNALLDKVIDGNLPNDKTQLLKTVEKGEL